VYTGLTTNINNANFINGITTLIPVVNGYVFNIQLLSSIPKIYLFIEHCDGHVSSVPSSVPKLQGGYQIVSVDLTCSDCYEPIPSITPSITPTPTITPSITPTISVTPSLTPTSSLTPSITPTISVTPSLTPTSSLTPSITPTISVTPSITPTSSLTPSVTPSPTICCRTWTLTDTGAHVHFNWVDCNGVSQTWNSGGFNGSNTVCACQTPYINTPPGSGWSITLISNDCTL
jgi:hypothetical protein